MKIVYDVEDESEVVTDVDIAPEGTRLPITKSYRQIINVNPTLHEIGTDAVSVQIVDKNPELGPLLKVFNGSKVPTTGRVSAEIQGIKR